MLKRLAYWQRKSERIEGIERLAYPWWQREREDDGRPDRLLLSLSLSLSRRTATDERRIRRLLLLPRKKISEEIIYFLH